MIRMGLFILGRAWPISAMTNRDVIHIVHRDFLRLQICQVTSDLLYKVINREQSQGALGHHRVIEKKCNGLAKWGSPHLLLNESEVRSALSCHLLFSYPKSCLLLFPSILPSNPSSTNSLRLQCGGNG